MSHEHDDYGRRFVDERGLVHAGYGKYGILYTQCQFHWNLPPEMTLGAYAKNAHVTCLWCSLVLLHVPRSA